MDLLLSLLGMAAMRLPVLIALAVSLVWVVDTPRGAIRSVALWALGLLLAGTVGGCLLIHELLIRRVRWLRPLFGLRANPPAAPMARTAVV